EQARHGRPVNIGVENADLKPVGGKAKRQIDRRGGLADAALARCNRDDRADARNARLRRRALRRRGMAVLRRGGCWSSLGFWRRRRVVAGASALLFGG